MKPRSAEAERLEADYLARVRATLGESVEAAEIYESVREHIEAAVAEFKDPEVSLVQMAGVIERLGRPESFRESAPAKPRTGDSEAAVRLLDKLWVASLIKTVGLYVPIIDFYFCHLIGSIMMVHVLQGDLPPELRSARRLALVTSILTVVVVPAAVLGLYQPLAGILEVPLGIALFVVPLLLYWNLIGGIASLLRASGVVGVATSLLDSRRTYVAIQIVLFAVSLIAGVVVAVANPDRKSQQLAVAAIGLALLPLGWILGALFILKPISRARRALAGAAPVSGTSAEGRLSSPPAGAP